METTTIPPTDRPATTPRTSPDRLPPGLKGVVVGSTTVGDVQGAQGFYHYRQYDATELARSRSFEDVVALVLDGVLPSTRQESLDASARLGAHRSLPGAVLDALPAVVAASHGGLAALRSALSLLASAWDLAPTMDLDDERRRHDVLRLCAATPTLVAALHRLANGRDPIAPDPTLGVASDYLRMLHGEVPDETSARALEVYLSCLLYTSPSPRDS